MTKDIDYHQIEQLAKARLHQTGRVGVYHNTSTAIMQLLVAGTHLVSAIVIGLLFFLVIGLGTLGSMLVGVILALLPSGYLGKRWTEKETQEVLQYEADIRANREAEKQKQIDAMLREASNIPNVKR